MKDFTNLMKALSILTGKDPQDASHKSMCVCEMPGSLQVPSPVFPKPENSREPSCRLP